LAKIVKIWDTIAEARLAQAEREGVFRNLPGAGRPLPEDIDPIIPAEQRMVTRVLKSAGAVPVEIEQRRAIHDMEQALTVSKNEARKELLLKLALLRATQERSALPSTTKKRLPF
jgi:Domain of unknown function (DUF1992)